MAIDAAGRMERDDFLTFLFMFIGTGFGGLVIGLAAYLLHKREPGGNKDLQCLFASFYFATGASAVAMMCDNPFAWVSFALSVFFFVALIKNFQRAQ